jgi:hypothetical protein
MSIDQPFHRVCKANRCPLPVRRVTDWWPPSGAGQQAKPRWGVCRWHALAEGSDWPKATEAILGNVAILRLMHEIERMPDETRPMLGELFQDWLARLDQYVWSRVLPGSDRGYPPVAEQLAELKRHLTGAG